MTLPAVVLRAVVLAAALLAAAVGGGCVSLPQADADVARALATADPRGRVDLLRRQGEEIAGVPFSGGNAVHLLRDGPASYAAMREAILGARRSIEMESYGFDQDEGRDFAALLTQARQRGVSVSLVYDAWGSLDTPAALFGGLREAGVQVLEFSPIDPAAVLENLVDRRDHRKLLVVDGRLAITGGVNISAVYLRRHGADGDGTPWRDTDVRIEGPAVAEYERRFRQVWQEQEGPPLPPEPSPPGPAGDLYVQVIANTPAQHEHAIYRSLLVAIALARRSVHLTTGFFAPTPALVKALRQAARRGVEVEVLVPSRSTSDLAIKAGRAKYEDLLEDGVRIYEYQQRVLHAKTAVIDGDWCSVGSSNLDWRSVALNNEINTVILSAAFGQEMEAMFRDDLTRAKAIDLAQWRRRPFAERFNEWKAGLFEVVL
jgi:cardiolipin synthase